MRTINNPDATIAIQADDQDNANGSASHRYELMYVRNSRFAIQHIDFQHGPILESGVNGVTNEALLLVVQDRLRCFQMGKFACKENEIALTAVDAALAALESRTAARRARKVEGTSNV